MIRPTVEELGTLSANGHIGVCGTPGTVQSRSYVMEIEKLHPGFVTVQQACPMWVPLVENREASSPGADYFVRQELDRLFARDPMIDTLLLACTHYPLLYDKIRRYTPESARVVTQGAIVARSLRDYLDRHQSMRSRCSTGGKCVYLTTESEAKFSELASVFVGEPVKAANIEL